MSLPYIFDLPTETSVEEDHDILVYQDNKLKKVNSKNIFYSKTQVKEKILDPKSSIINSLKSLEVNINENASLKDILDSMTSVDLLEIGVRRMVHNGTDTSTISTPYSVTNSPRFAYMGVAQTAPQLDRCIRVGKSTMIIPAVAVSSRNATTDFLYAGMSVGNVMDRNDFYGINSSDGISYTSTSSRWKNGIYPWNSMQKVTDESGSYTRVPLYYIKNQILTENGVDISSSWPKIPAEFLGSIIYEYTFVCKSRLSGYRPAAFFIKYDPRAMVEDANGEYIYIQDLDCYKKFTGQTSQTKYTRDTTIPSNPTSFTKILTNYHDFACYEGSVDTVNGVANCLVSKAGVLPKTSVTLANFRTYINNTEKAMNGGVATNLNEYYINDIRSWNDFFCVLFDIEFATTNCQQIAEGRSGYNDSDGGGAPYSASYKVQETVSNTNTIKVNCKGFDIGDYIGIGTSAGNSSVASERLVTDYIDNEDGTYTITFDGSPVNVTTGNVVWEGKAVCGSTDISPYRTANANTKHYSTFKWNWIENPYAHIWKFVEGIHIRHESDTEISGTYINSIYVCNNPRYFSSTTGDSNYKKLSYIMPSQYESGSSTAQNSYVSQLGYDYEYPWVRLTSKLQSSSSNQYGDYYYEDSKSGIADRCLVTGGGWYYGAHDGLRFFAVDDFLGFSYVNFGASSNRMEG